MEGNNRDSKISLLSPRQQGALPVVAASPTIAQAARDCRIGESTLRRWLRDPDFAQELDLLRQEHASQVSQQYLGLILRSMNVFAECMESPDPTLSLRAARYAMSTAFHLHESLKLHADIREMRDTLDSVQSGKYINQPESGHSGPQN